MVIFRARGGSGRAIPYVICVLVGKALACMVLSSQDQGLLRGFRVSEISQEIPITQYADDTLIMLEVKAEAIGDVRVILLWFKAVAGLRMNVNKAKMYQVNECREFKEQREDWGCKWTLSVPWSSFGCGLQILMHVKIPRKHLAIWKRKYRTK